MQAVQAASAAAAAIAGVTVPHVLHLMLLQLLVLLHLLVPMLQSVEDDPWLRTGLGCMTAHCKRGLQVSLLLRPCMRF